MSGTRPLGGGGGGLTPIADQRFLANFTGAPATPVATEIVAGPGITLTPGANQLTIEAPGGTGSGTVTQVDTGAGLTGGPISSAGTVSLAAFNTGFFLANFSGGSASPIPVALTVGSGVTYSAITASVTVSLTPIADQRLFGNYSGGALAPQAIQLVAGSGITFSGTTASLTITASGSATAPTIVQQATDRSTTGSDTTLSLTFATATTTGNFVVFLVNGFSNSSGGGNITVTGINQYLFRDRGTSVANQGAWIYAMPVTTSTTSYSVSIGSPNGGENCLALELSAFGRLVANTIPGATGGATVSSTLSIITGALNFLLITNDNDTGAVVAATSGLTTLYSGIGNSTNHAGYFFSIADSLQVSNSAVQFTSNPTGGTLQVLVSITK